MLAVSGITKKKKQTTSREKKSETITYQSENGPVEVPANPERVVVLSIICRRCHALGVNIVGVDSWSTMNPILIEGFKDAEEVADENLEKIIELNPDLIIGLSILKMLIN